MLVEARPRPPALEAAGTARLDTTLVEVAAIDWPEIVVVVADPGDVEVSDGGALTVTGSVLDFEPPVVNTKDPELGASRPDKLPEEPVVAKSNCPYIPAGATEAVGRAGVGTDKDGLDD